MFIVFEPSHDFKVFYMFETGQEEPGLIELIFKITDRGIGIPKVDLPLL